MEIPQGMYKIFAPRGGGRTYQICKYAIENDCDIIVPTSLNVELVTKTIIFLCESSYGKWTYRGYRVDSREVYVDTEEKRLTIRVFSALDFQLASFGHNAKQVVIDDVDLCMQYLIGGRNIAACSIATYDPSDVALRHETTGADDPAIERPAPQLTCRSLL